MHRRRFVEVVIIMSLSLRWSRSCFLRPTSRYWRRSRQTILRCCVSERIVFVVFRNRWLPVGRWRGRSPRRLHRAPALRWLGGRRRGNSSRSRGWYGGWYWGSCLFRAPRRLKRMVISCSALVEARIALMSFKSIFEFSPRRNVRIVVAIVFSHLALDILTSLTRTTGSAICRRSTAWLAGKRRRRRPSLCWGGHGRACWNRRGRAAVSLVRRLGWRLWRSRIVSRRGSRIEMFGDGRARSGRLRALGLVCRNRIQRLVLCMN